MLPEENSILLGVPANGLSAALLFPYTLGCANKDLDRSLGPLGKFIEYCRTGSSATVLQYFMNLPKGPKDPSRTLLAQPIIHCT